MAKKYFGEAALRALTTLVQTALGTKVDNASIVNDLASEDATKVLSAAQGKILDGKITAAGSGATEEIGKIKDGTTQVGDSAKLGGKVAADYALAQTVTDGLSAKLDANKVGVASGVAPLDGSGIIDSQYLPSYVDDVVEGYYDAEANKFYKETEKTTEITGETSKIYIDLETNISYRYSGSTYVAITSSDLSEIDGTTVESIWNAGLTPPSGGETA